METFVLYIHFQNTFRQRMNQWQLCIGKVCYVLNQGHFQKTHSLLLSHDWHQKRRMHLLAGVSGNYWFATQRDTKKHQTLWKYTDPFTKINPKNFNIDSKKQWKQSSFSRLTMILPLGLAIESKKSIKSIFRKIEKIDFFPTDFFDFFDSENVAKNVAFWTYFSLFKDFLDFFLPSLVKWNNFKAFLI